MTQYSPSNLIYTRVIYHLAKLRKTFMARQDEDADELTKLISSTISEIEKNPLGAITKYEPIAYGEVPNSSKMNRFWSSSQMDINSIIDQLETLSAASIELFNRIEVGIQSVKNENNRIQNKLKVLSLYSSAIDPSILNFGDYFISEDLIDFEMTPSGSDLNLNSRHALMLKPIHSFNTESGDVTVKILEGSNGVPGNWRQLFNPTDYSIDIDSEENPFNYYLKSEVYPANDLISIVDTKPDTWFEFEQYKVSDIDRERALQYNFYYNVVDHPDWEYLKPFATENSLYDWASGVGASGVLRLNLEFEFKNPINLNLIKVMPFGLEENANHPLMFKDVRVSSDKTNWKNINPTTFWVSNGISREVGAIGTEEVFVGEAALISDVSHVKYLRMTIEQHKSLPSDIAHFYYINKDQIEAQVRVEGPHPPIYSPNSLMDSVRSSTSLEQFVEKFEGERWCIGIRDIMLQSNTYHQTGSIVSKPFKVSGVIDRVALDAEIEIPDGYDNTIDWVKFYVSPDNGSTWHQISRIQDDNLDIPEIIAFNDPTPIQFREAGVGYRDIESDVDSIRVKIEMSRPSEMEYTTPVVKSYRLRVIKRQ